MKRILSTALAIVLFVGASQAQTTENKRPHHNGQKQEMAMSNVNLTADQKAKLKAIRQAQKSEIEAMKKNGNVTQEQRKALREKYRSQFQAVLTPAQQEQLKTNSGKWKAKGQKGQALGKRGGKAGKQAAFLKKDLNLTADQESKLKGMFQSFRAKAQDIRSNNSLTKEQKKEQMKSLAQQFKTESKAVLTPEQLQKFNEQKGKRKNNRKSENV